MDRLPPLRLLTVFETVNRLGGARAAAAELNVSQSAVSQALKSLEEHVGAPLFDRSSRPARLTPAGRRLSDAAREGLALIAEAIHEIRVADAQAGAITVACTLGMATHWLMPRLPLFYARWPDTLVSVQADPGDLKAVSDPGGGARAPAGVDVVLHYRGQRAGDAALSGRTRRLFPERIAPVGRPDVLARAALHPDGLSGAPLIHVSSDPGARWESWPDYFRACRLSPPRGKGLRFSTYVHAVQAALDGHGIMLGWRSITGDLTDEGRLAEWPGGAVDFGSAYFVTLAPEAAEKPAARHFADWVLEEGDGPDAATA